MARPKSGKLLFTRSQGGATRFYADLRRFADVGGRKEPLVAQGERVATTDPIVAQKLLSDRLAALEAKRRGRTLHGITKQGTLAELAREHLIAMKRSQRYTDGWLYTTEAYLKRLVGRLGADRDVTTVTVADVRGLVEWLGRQRRWGRGKRDNTLSSTTVRHYLGTLGKLFRRGISEGYLAPGANPVSALMEKPRSRPSEARWLEVDEAALVLEAARAYEAPEGGTAFGYPLVAFFLLTGGRETEVYGVEQDDVSFERKTVTFRPNAWRRLKTAGSKRTVRLWPQLEEILREYLRGPTRPTGALLFPRPQPVAPKKGPKPKPLPEAMLCDSRKLLNHIGMAAGYAPGALRSKMFRHTYCVTRLQTLDRRAPVPIWTVSQELGHSSIGMFRRFTAI